MGIAERWRGRPPLPEDILDRIEALEPVFRRHAVRLAYVFGSLAEGRPGDDVDLAVLLGKGSVLELWTDLSDALGTDRLDLVDLATASPVLRFGVVRDGRLLYRESEETENEFEMAAIREYKDTHHHRAIQDAYLKEWAEGWS
jgi:predicted nucleotidyltransferase